MDLDEQTKALAKEFSVLLDPKTTLTPRLCRKGCKHYDSVGDQKNAVVTGNPPMKNFLALRPNCDLPAFLVNVDPNKNFLAPNFILFVLIPPPHC